MRLEVGDALPDLFALGLHPIHGRHPVCFDANALRKSHRFFDERIKIGVPIDHCDFPLRRQPIGPSPGLSLLGGVNTVDNWADQGTLNPALAFAVPPRIFRRVPCRVLPPLIEVGIGALW